MGAVIGLAFCALVLLAFVVNRDLFSPAKLFLVSYLVFHVGILEGHRPLEVWLLVLLVLAVGAIAVTFEALNSPGWLRRAAHRPTRPQSVLTEPRRIFLGLWLLSLPAIAAQLYMIASFGGLDGYILALANRVVEWRGLGWARTVIGTMATFNLLYLAIGLTRRRSRSWWVGYTLHFLFVLLVGLLSGSRSAILNVIVMQIMIFHYLRSEVRLRTALPVAVVLIAAGLVLGTVRETFRLDDGELRTGLAEADEILNLPTLRYGVTPLEILVDAGQLRLAYGSTLISMVTNAVPRDWWPDKPDTGGVFFTKEYTGDEWDGSSNMTPTILGEFVINFGWIAGIVIYAVAYPFLFYIVIRQYHRVRRLLRRRRSAQAAMRFVTYLVWMWSVVALMTGELTNVLLVMVLTGLIPISVVRFYASRRTLPRPAAGTRAGLVSPV